MITTDVAVKFTLNGILMERNVPPNWTLLRFLHEGLGFTGTKCGCEIGECGACTVLFNGDAVNACLVLAAQINGANIWTIEGLAPSGRQLHPIQQAFVECDAVHCGFCSPGMVMSTVALLLHNRKPSNIMIRESLAGNLCRCTGYIQIIEAVSKAAESLDDADLEKFR
jgi:carbon-monoxide dehydrogenase small subunit